MIIDLNESQIRTLAQVRAVLDGTQTLDFAPAADARARCDWIASVLRRLYYPGLKRKADRGLVLTYLRHFSGFSRAQITRLVRRWRADEPLHCVKGVLANAFARRYTEADLDALADVEREYGSLSGPAAHVPGLSRSALRAFAASIVLASLQPAPLDDLSRTPHTVKTKTRSDPKGAAIAARR